MLNNYKYEDGWRMISKFAFGITVSNIFTGETVTIPNQ
jgi:hypothetical protein